MEDDIMLEEQETAVADGVTGDEPDVRVPSDETPAPEMPEPAEEVCDGTTDLDAQIREAVETAVSSRIAEAVEGAVARAVSEALAAARAEAAKDTEERVAAAIRETEERLIGNIRARGQRPPESGMTSAVGVRMHPAVDRLTRRDREELARMAARGERVRL